MTAFFGKIRNIKFISFLVLLLSDCSVSVSRASETFITSPIAPTGQDQCYSEIGEVIACPASGQRLSGQDAQFAKSAPTYRVNNDGTVTDMITGLMWAKAPSHPLSFSDIENYARASRIGGYQDWRVPNIHELYSLIDYRGGYTGDPTTSRPYIDTTAFDFAYGAGSGLGDASHSKRPIDVQEWSSTRYIGKTMGHDDTVFGVNFADGRIKGYPVMDPANFMKTPHLLAVRLVRGASYGTSEFVASTDQIADHATGLVWQRQDDGQTRSWADALRYCEMLRLGGEANWRLPNAKELHSIVDYTRGPAIDPLFKLSEPKAYLWSSTTHLESPPSDGAGAFSHKGELAVYAAIGPALGYMEVPPGSRQKQWIDVHGAGAMRSDPKTSKPGQFPEGFGPQGDDIRGDNYVLCVRTGK